MCKAHIALKDLQAVAMMLCRIAFQLSANVVTLHLNNSTVKLIYSISSSFLTCLVDIKSD